MRLKYQARILNIVLFIQWIFTKDSCRVSSFVLSFGDILMNKIPSYLRSLNKNYIWSGSGRSSRETKKLKEEEMQGRGLVELLYLIIQIFLTYQVLLAGVAFQRKKSTKEKQNLQVDLDPLCLCVFLFFFPPSLPSALVSILYLIFLLLYIEQLDQQLAISKT